MSSESLHGCVFGPFVLLPAKDSVPPEVFTRLQPRGSCSPSRSRITAHRPAAAVRCPCCHKLINQRDGGLNKHRDK